MNTDERTEVLEARVSELESELSKRTPKPAVSFQRMVQDERGRGIVVTVGGNNGGY